MHSMFLKASGHENPDIKQYSCPSPYFGRSHTHKSPSLSYAWEPVIDPWDSHGRFERGQKIALVRYFEPNCTTQLEQNHINIRGVRKHQCHNFEYPFASLAFEYPRLEGRWLMVRGCRISIYQGPDCEDELPRRGFATLIPRRSSVWISRPRLGLCGLKIASFVPRKVVTNVDRTMRRLSATCHGGRYGWTMTGARLAEVLPNPKAVPCILCQMPPTLWISRELRILRAAQHGNKRAMHGAVRASTVMYGKRFVSAAICCLFAIAHASDLPLERSELNNVNTEERRALAEAGDFLDRRAQKASVDEENPVTHDIGLATLFDAIVSPAASTLIKVAGRANKLGKRQDNAQVTAPTSTVTITTATTQVATLTSSFPSTTTVVSTRDVTFTTSFVATTTAVSTIQGRTVTSTSLTLVTSTYTSTAQTTSASTLVQTTTAVSTQPTTAISTLDGGTATLVATTFQTVTATVTGPTSTVQGQAVTQTLPPTTVQVQRATAATRSPYPSNGPCAYVFRNGPVVYCEGYA
ncbi:hypothetical protein BST61_g11111 [Cercospora zeina]